MSTIVFNKVDYTLGGLIDQIAMGTIGLPDIQRPFVWKNTKVRNLFDSMYQGYPVGYLLFWENAGVEGGRVIGTDTKQRPPQLLIVDGQQRLTSLYAVIKGVPVVRENYESEKIEIAFNPLLGKFEVADAAIRRNKLYIPNISVIWDEKTDIFELVDNYLKALTTDREITDEERITIRRAFSKLQNLINYPFTALVLSPNISEEQVSEVFVRINSEGKTLNQADFILTLMSVFWDEGRAQLEDFCRRARKPVKGEPSPYNHFIEPDPDQLLRVSVGLGFRRARLQYVYSILRGKDLETEQFSPERREAQFEVLKQAQAKVLNLQYWHDFMKAIIQAGFRSGQLISSQNNLLFAYILYLMGRTEFAVDEFKLRNLIARWFFMTALTGRYSTSPESRMEFDLARFREVKDANTFMAVLDEICSATLTNDFWTITLPTELATAAARSPSMFAFYAALNLQDARVLFSKQKVSELMDPTTKSLRSSIERHHLFPKAYLQSIDITDNRLINQNANFTMMEWGDNAKIRDKAPREYVPELKKRFSNQELERMYYWHALPDNWENMEYQDFLRRRRELMAGVIRDAYMKLSGASPEEPLAHIVPVEQLVSGGESVTVEFKSTLRVNLHTGEKDPRIELSVLKTIAAFVNSNGGTLIIGVADDGDPVGIEADNFGSEDRMYLHLVNLLNSRLGPHHMIYIHPRFDDYQDVRVMVVECLRGNSPVFVKDGAVERFYVRTGAATIELFGSQMQDFIKQRFGS
jgi:hypothetical protein